MDPLPLAIHVHTPHGRPVIGADVQILGPWDDCQVIENPGGVYQTTLPEPGDYHVVIAARRNAGGFDHRTFRTTLFYVERDGSADVVALAQPDGERSKVSRDPGGAYRLDVTLDYLWFSPIGYEPTLGNRVDVLADGEDAWSAVADAIDASTRTVRLTTWIYQPTMALRRPSPLADPAERAPFTVQRVLEARARRGVLVQLLLWDAPFLGLPEELREGAETPGDSFEVMKERNPTRRPLLRDDEWHLYNAIVGDFQIGSYHQKTVIVDGKVGFCGGMNLRENDWDSRDHRLFDARRCNFSRPAAHRERVEERAERADHPPRHDFMARVEGPSVAHLEENFRQRWNDLIDRDAEFSAGSTRVDPPALPVPAGPSEVQVVRTMPAPLSERGILDVYLRAVRNAKRLVYVEDQYFRSTHVSDAIAEAAAASPELAVIVVSSEARANQALVGSWSWECFRRIAALREGFELYTLRCVETAADGAVLGEDVDNHAKLLVVDDTFLMVGSCNVNDRGFEYEGEISVAVVDPDLAGKLRVGLFREHLGGDARITGDVASDVAIWKEHAALNRAGKGLPGSHVFPFVPRRRARPFIAPDVF